MEGWHTIDGELCPSPLHPVPPQPAQPQLLNHNCSLIHLNAQATAPQLYTTFGPLVRRTCDENGEALLDEQSVREAGPGLALEAVEQRADNSREGTRLNRCVARICAPCMIEVNLTAAVELGRKDCDCEGGLMTRHVLRLRRWGGGSEMLWLWGRNGCCHQHLVSSISSSVMSSLSTDVALSSISGCFLCRRKGLLGRRDIKPWLRRCGRESSRVEPPNELLLRGLTGPEEALDE